MKVNSILFYLDLEKDDLHEILSNRYKKNRGLNYIIRA